MSNVTVLGGTGGLGRAICAELAGRGHDVTAVSRSGKGDVVDGVALRGADLMEPESAVEACVGADVVVMAANVPYARWATDLEPLVDNALVAASRAGARYLMVDNLYAYGSPGQPISVNSPEVADTRKGKIRRRIGQRILAAHRAGDVSATVVRFSDYYGPGGTNAMVHVLGVAPALRGKRPRAMVDPDQPHSFHYLPDAARAVAVLAERPRGDGAVWIPPAAPPLTQRALLTMVAEEVGAPTTVGRVTPSMLRLAGLFDSQIRELRELTGQWDRPYTIDSDAFESAFGGIEVTPHPEAVAQTVAAFRSEGDAS